MKSAEGVSMNPKSTLTDKQARIKEARERYERRAENRPRQVWIKLPRAFQPKTHMRFYCIKAIDNNQDL